MTYTKKLLKFGSIQNVHYNVFVLNRSVVSDFL